MSQTGPVLVLNTPQEAREWIASKRAAGATIGFVPTMGALHDGHLSLVKTALLHADFVIASIFVNPTQFAPGEDLDSYPRTLESDLAKLASVGCNAAFVPSVEDMYPEGDCTRVTVEGLSSILEGEFRPHFFTGVATVVSRLFNYVRPDIAVFGEKDYQQLQIIKRMVCDLGFGINIIGAPTIREDDGLAMSSRNQYLSETERAQAGGFAQALRRAADQISEGAAISVALAECYEAIDQAGLTPIDYVAVRDAQTLADVGDGVLTNGTQARLLAAAWMGKTRLIDNLPVSRS